MNTILAITALVVGLRLLAAFTIVIPALDGHIALAKNTKPKNPDTTVAMVVDNSFSLFFFLLSIKFLASFTISSFIYLKRFVYHA